jgi:hypothetical protein
MSNDNVLNKARAIDTQFGLDFESCSIPPLNKGMDVWLEIIYVCCASFAIAGIITPYNTYKYDDSQIKAPFDVVLCNAKQDLLKAIDKAVMYDAVLNTAIIWKHIWNKVSKE